MTSPPPMVPDLAGERASAVAKDPDRPTIAKFSLHQAVFMNLLFLVLLLGGGLVLSIIPVDVYPDVEFDEATVDTFWLGASAEDIERLITDRIEDEIMDIRGISRIISDSKPDASLIRIKFREDLTEGALDTSFRQLRAAVDRVTDLPAGAEKPLVTRISLSEIFPLIWIVVQDTGGVGEDVIHDVVLKLKPILRDLPGVAKVDDKLIRDRELRVRVNRESLREYEMTLDEVAAVLSQYNRNVPSGTLPDRRGEFTVRAVGEAMTPDQLGGIAVRKHHGGAHVYLDDVAEIECGFERERFLAHFNGFKCKALGVAKADEADSRDVAERVKQAIAQFQSSLPPGVNVSYCLDSSGIIRSRMKILLTNLVGGIGLVLLCLWGTMGLRNAALAIVGIPFSFMCAIIFMHTLGVTINAVSLFALVLCSGMIVDDAIVVLDNIYRHVEEARTRQGSPSTGDESRAGLDARSLSRAIINGTNEVMWPVISSSMTTVVAFLPLLIMTGVTGKFFAIIPKTVTVVLIASLFECLFMIPVHYLHWGPRQRVRPWRFRWWRRRQADLDPPRRSLGDGVLDLYDRLLAGVLRYRYLAPLPLLALGFAAYGYSGLLSVDLFPSDYQLTVVDIKAWDDASLEQTAQVIQPLEQVALGLGPELVRSVLATVGLVATDENTAKWRNNVAQLHVQLADTPRVAADPDRVTNQLRREIENYLSTHPDTGIRAVKVWTPQDGPPIGKPVAIRIQSPDLRAAKKLAEKYKERLVQIPGVYGIADDLDFGPKQINLRLNEVVASAHGLTQPDLSRALRTANEGLVVSTFKDTQSGEDLDVRVRFDERDRRTLDDLLDIHIRAPGGYLLRLGDICELDMSQGYSSVPHFNGKRVVTVGAQIDTNVNTAQNANATIEEAFHETLAAMPDVRVTYGGEYEETTRSFTSLKEAYLMAIVVIYMLLAAQFYSYAQPFVIIVTVPFSCVGVIGGLLVADYPFTIMTFIAMVGLTGVVVNDSIVLIDFINHQLTRGLPMEQALRTACRLRLRPILLTTITTVLGLLPLALGLGGRSKIWSPFASSFAWGLMFATVVTLVIVPALYHIAYDLLAFGRRIRADRESRRAPASATANVG